MILVTECALMDPLLTTAQVAHWLQKHPDVIRDMAQRGDLPAIKIGRDWRFDRARIERWLRGEEDTGAGENG